MKRKRDLASEVDELKTQVNRNERLLKYYRVRGVYDKRQLMTETTTHITGNLTEKTTIKTTDKDGEFSLTVRHSLYPASLYLASVDEANKLMQMIRESIDWYEELHELPTD